MVHGSGFAPGAKVTLEWLPGIGTVTATAGTDGTFNIGLLVLFHDLVGARQGPRPGFSGCRGLPRPGDTIRHATVTRRALGGVPPLQALAAERPAGEGVDDIRRHILAQWVQDGAGEPAATYSATLARHSSGVPQAVIICTMSSGTRAAAATTCSWVAGQVRTRPISSSSDAGTPDAFMMCGCWPRYWVTSRRARSMAVARSASTEHTTSWGRSTSSSDLPAWPPPGEVLECRTVVRRRHQVVEDDAVGDLTGQLHHLHPGGADVDGHVLGRRSW